jgi:hypothetical protein
VLLIGESWFTQLMEVKGFDSFTVSGYEVGTQWIEPALTGDGHDFRHLPSHLVDRAWPDLSDVDVVLVSDCGANTFLLGTATFTGGEPVSNKLAELAEFVRGGGGLDMIGGYLSFSGIDAKAQYAGTPLADVLPVVIARTDDRVELPQGVTRSRRSGTTWRWVAQRVSGRCLAITRCRHVPRRTSSRCAVMTRWSPPGRSVRDARSSTPAIAARIGHRAVTRTRPTMRACGKAS